MDSDSSWSPLSRYQPFLSPLGSFYLAKMGATLGGRFFEGHGFLVVTSLETKQPSVEYSSWYLLKKPPPQITNRTSEVS